ncbi:MAG: FecR family protein [Patescibacteria group bacterium]|nr:FecR family protein [Patescibacteria group bacterium]
MKKIGLFLIVLSILEISGCAKKEAPEVFQGKVLLTVGDVQIDGAAGQTGATVFSNSIIKTGKDSSCEIIFDEKNILRILDNSLVTLDMQNLRKILKIQSGGLETVVKNLKKSKDSSLPPFEVQTATAVAAVRGTTFYIRVLNDSNTAFCDCNGVVSLANPGETNLQIVESSHHTGFVLTSGTDGYQVIPAKITYKDDAELKKLAGHNDQEMEDLAGKIGVKIDWNTVDRSIR